MRLAGIPIGPIDKFSFIIAIKWADKFNRFMFGAFIYMKMEAIWLNPQQDIEVQTATPNQIIKLGMDLFGKAYLIAWFLSDAFTLLHDRAPAVFFSMSCIAALTKSSDFWSNYWAVGGHIGASILFSVILKCACKNWANYSISRSCPFCLDEYENGLILQVGSSNM